MNQKTQLQFNLGITPNPCNLATHFNPGRQHSPVVIDKVPAGTVGLSHTPVEAFKAVSTDKLVLAMKYAKRNLEHGISHDLHSRLVRRHSVIEDDSTPQLNSSCGVDEPPVHKTHSSQIEDVSIYTSKNKSISRDPPKPKEEIKREISQLKGELQMQLSRVNRAKRKKTWSFKEQPMGRLEDGEENLEREQRRREEQMSRNARMIYDLSQQVKGLERGIISTKQDTPHQYTLRKKIAAAQRSALRILQGYDGRGHHSPDPTPPGLSLLIQQLSLLSSQIGGVAGNELLLQVMDSLEEKQRMVKLEKDNAVKNLPPSDKQGAKGKKMASGSTKKRKTTRRTGDKGQGVLVTSKRQQSTHNRSTHYAHPTFNSVERQQPLQPYTPITQPHTPPPPEVQDDTAYQGTPRPCYLHHPSTSSPPPNSSPTINRRVNPQAFTIEMEPQFSTNIKKKKAKTLSVLRKQAKMEINMRDGVDTSPDKSLLLPSSGRVKNSSASPDGDDHVVVDSRNIHSAIASQERELQKMREDISQKLMELKSYIRGQQHNGNNDGLQSSNTPFSPPQAVQPLIRIPENTIPDLLKILEQLEAEEEVIRQRWTTIIYEDPLIKKPPIIHNSAMQRDSSPTHIGPSGRQNPSLPQLSPDTLSSIQDYRKQYSHYLSGLSTQGRVIPWDKAEKIADGLLGDILEGVASEVGKLCDNYVEGMYAHEFIIGPP